MKEHKNEFSVEKMAKVLNVSCAGYYKFINKQESPREKENKQFAQAIREIHVDSRGVYGSPRIHAVLKKQGKKCSRKRVASLNIS